MRVVLTLDKVSWVFPERIFYRNNLQKAITFAINKPDKTLPKWHRIHS